MDNEQRAPRFRLGGSLVLAVALGIAAAAKPRPAFGQANTSCTTQQLNDNEFTCDDCTSYETCFNEATESLYYSVQGQRFDCNAYDCTQARERLLDLCCDTEPTSSSAGSDEEDGGCAFVRFRSPDASSVSWVCVLVAALSMRRKRGRPS